MDVTEIYRMLAADRFDLLSEGEKRQLAESLERNPHIDAADFSDRLVAALKHPGDKTRDIAFLEALGEAERELAGPQAGSAAKRALSRRVNPVLRLALAAALGAAFMWGLVGQPEAPAPVGHGGQAVILNAQRASGGPSVDLDASSATHLTLFVEVEIEESSVEWQLLHGDLRPVLGGSFEFPEAGPVLRSLALHIPKDQLEFETGYWVVLLNAEGEALRRWAFRVE